MPKLLIRLVRARLQNMQGFTWTRFLIAEVFLLACCYCQNENACSHFEFLGDNILTNETRDHFGFTVYPSPASNWGEGKNVADEDQQLSTLHWRKHGVHSKADPEGIAYIQVNLKEPYYLKGFAVTGYSGGSNKPTGSFFLEGSNDECHWQMVAEGKADQWHAPGTYPFRPSQIVKALYPGRYQFYRVIARGWANGHMLIQNLGLFA